MDRRGIVERSSIRATCYVSGGRSGGRGKKCFVCRSVYKPAALFVVMELLEVPEQIDVDSLVARRLGLFVGVRKEEQGDPSVSPVYGGGMD